MGTTISIETSSFQKNPSGGSRNLSIEEVTALATACSQLLEEIGDLRNRVEVIKVTPWHAYGHPNIFVVRAVLSMHGDSLKIEAQHTFEHHTWRGCPKPDWDLEELRVKIVSEMKWEIHCAIRNRVFNLKQTQGGWEKHIPIDLDIKV